VTLEIVAGDYLFGVDPHCSMAVPPLFGQESYIAGGKYTMSLGFSGKSSYTSPH
jgi:hypothetical protein